MTMTGKSTLSALCDATSKCRLACGPMKKAANETLKKCASYPETMLSNLHVYSKYARAPTSPNSVTRPRNGTVSVGHTSTNCHEIAAVSGFRPQTAPVVLLIYFCLIVPPQLCTRLATLPQICLCAGRTGSGALFKCAVSIAHRRGAGRVQGAALATTSALTRQQLHGGLS